MEQEIYYDNSATTRVRPQAAQTAMDLMALSYGNPSSLHRLGFEAQQKMELARRQVAQSLGCEPGCITFTSGGTEADNLAILGGCQAMRRRGGKVVTTAFEHDAVLKTADFLESQGWQVIRLLPDSQGQITPQQVLEAVDEETVLVSVMAVNNEVGSILPVGQIAKALRRQYPQILIHCDAVQAWGKHPLKVGKSLDVDMLSVSGHKIYAPKGIGALYVKEGVRLKPLLFGGGQEKNLRPGTENIAYACAMGAAISLLSEEMEANRAKAKQIKELLLQGLKNFENVRINSPADGTPYILNFSLPGIRSEIMLHFLEERGIYLSSGSACTKGAPSHVLTAMGFSRETADSALRVSFGRENTVEQVPVFLTALEEGIKRIKR